MLIQGPARSNRAYRSLRIESDDASEQATSMLRLTARFAALLALAACATGGFHPGWLMLANSDGTAVTYSGRFEHVERIAADRVGMLFSLTLAPDRVSPGADGMVTELRALEFINLSNEAVTFSLESLRLRGAVEVPLSPAEFTLAPRASAAIRPVEGRASVFQRRDQDFRLRYRYSDSVLEIAGSADRLTVRELEERTHAGLGWRFK